METQVENNAKNKQTNKQISKEKKGKKRICTELNHWKIEELDKILEKKELNVN